MRRASGSGRPRQDFVHGDDMSPLLPSIQFNALEQLRSEVTARIGTATKSISCYIRSGLMYVVAAICVNLFCSDLDRKSWVVASVLVWPQRYEMVMIIVVYA